MNYKEIFLKGKLPDIKIYDVHGHIGIFPNTNKFNTDYKSVVKVMDRIGIEKTIISSADAILGNLQEGNDEVEDAVKNSSGKLMGYITINPLCENGLTHEITRLENKDFVGIKYHPAYSKTPINDEKMQEVLNYINDKGYILLVHAFSKGEVEKTYDVIKEFPDIKFIIAHSGTQSGYKLTAEIIKNYENAYCDISISMPKSDMLEHLVKYGDENKILFGSDTPLTDPSIQIGRILLSDISDIAKEKILGKNFVKLFLNSKYENYQ